LFVEGFEIPPEIDMLVKGGLENAIGIITAIASGIPIFTLGRSDSLGIINFILSIPVCYFLLVDGEKLTGAITALASPEKVEVYRKYLSRIDWILSGIFLGSIYTSIVGGIISAAVFFAFGVPRPFALASIVFIAGMVPILTTWAVLVPIALYRYVSMGPFEAALFFVVSSMLIYLPSELLIRPLLVSAKSSVHPLLAMLSFLGGALVAGVSGFFLAPAIMGVIVGIYQVRREEAAACNLGEAGL
jgi:predicted PurR-regulated permease PerM